MEDNLNRLTGSMKEFKRLMHEGVNIYNELLNIVNEQNKADVDDFLSKVPSLTNEEIVRDASVLAGEKRGRSYIFDLMEKTIESVGEVKE